MPARSDIARLTDEVARVRSAILADENAFASDPVAMMEAAGLPPDPWQAGLLRTESKRTLLLVTRQGGKSTTTAGRALHRALYRPGALVLLLSPSLRQSQELFNKVVSTYRGAGEPVAVSTLSALRMEFAHGSRIVALPGTEKTVRGFSGVDLLIIDEAARVDDALYYSVRPMLAVSGGELIALTTPWGKRGWFYDEWENGGADWQRIRVTAEECPRISPEFLAEERRKMPLAWFESEYLCRFTDTVDQAFTGEQIAAAFTPDVKPLFTSEPVPAEASAYGVGIASGDGHIVPLDLD